MKQFPEYISEKRRAAPSPAALVENGQAHFGTFESAIPVLNLLDCKKPCGKCMPEFMKKARYTEWEAFEIHIDEGIVVSAVYNMGIIGFNIIVFYDKREGKEYHWVNFTNGKNAKVAKNLLDSKSELLLKKGELTIENYFGDKKCRGRGKAASKKFGEIEFDMKGTGLSDSCVVSIPFDKNKPLYSQKEFFKAEGFLTLNGERFETNERSTIIIDDHKGFYPFSAHYDWLTTMGKTKIEGEEKYLAINFTRNQSIDQDAYNENILWLEGESYVLPPVYFDKKSKTEWRIFDDHGTVDVTFSIDKTFVMKMNAVLLKIDYNLPFGTLKGFVKDHEGRVYELDGMYGIGEDKTTRI